MTVRLIALATVAALVIVAAAHASTPAGVNVLVFTRDVPEGTEFDTSMLAAKTVPIHLATSSVIEHKNLSYLFGIRTAVPVLKGDLARWPVFAPKKSEAEQSLCEKLIRPGSARDQLARVRSRLLEQ